MFGSLEEKSRGNTKVLETSTANARELAKCLPLRRHENHGFPFQLASHATILTWKKNEDAWQSTKSEHNNHDKQNKALYFSSTPVTPSTVSPSKLTVQRRRSHASAPRLECLLRPKQRQQRAVRRFTGAFFGASTSLVPKAPHPLKEENPGSNQSKRTKNVVQRQTATRK